MKKRINLLYMIMALVTIVASVSIACTEIGRASCRERV